MMSHVNNIDFVSNENKESFKYVNTFKETVY